MWPDKDALQWAHHEAGHAVAMAELEVPFQKVLISEEERFVEGAVHPSFRNINLHPPEDLEAAKELTWDDAAQLLIRKCLVTLAAGPVSQMIYEEREPPFAVTEFYIFGGGNDADNIRRYAMGLAVMNSKTTEELLSTKRRLIHQAVNGASRFVNEFWDPITNVASLLHDRGELSYKEVSATLRRHHDEQG